MSERIEKEKPIDLEEIREFFESLGNEQRQLIATMYDAVEAAYKRGLADGAKDAAENAAPRLGE